METTLLEGISKSGQGSPRNTSEQPTKYKDVVKDNNNSGGDDDDSLTLSITPPIPEDNKELKSSNSSVISEHISSSNGSENDRSLQEIEITNFSMILQNLPSSDNEQNISQEQKPLSLNSSFNNNNNSNNHSIISLNALERFAYHNMEGNYNVRSILEEILNNEQFNDKSSVTESKESSLNIFANVDLDDNILNLSYNNCKNSLVPPSDFNLNNTFDDDINKKVKDFEELIAVKDTTIAALTSELDSLREIMSNPSSNSLGTSTEYKQYQEECHNKLIEYHNAVVHKDELIQKLTESLHQSVLNREELKQQTENLKNEIAQLQEKFEQTSIMIKQHKCDHQIEKSSVNNYCDDEEFDEKCSKFANNLNLEQINLFNDFKIVLNNYIEEKKTSLKAQIETDRDEYENEITRLRQLLANIKCGSTELMELKEELDTNHSKEMEELRTYFEKKCADLEKNYSEEVFSQQSRKMSGSSSSSDIELPSDFVFSSNHQPGPSGDHNKFDYTKKDLMKLQNDLKIILNLINNFNNIIDLNDDDFNLLKSEIGKFDLKNLIKYDLTIIQNDLQNKYHAELEILREDFDNRVDLLNLEHEKKLNCLENKFKEEIDLLNDQLHGIARREPINISSAVQEVASLNDFEINEVVQSYERRLQEQIAQAKIDIIAALQIQIQRLAANDNIDEEWPSELLQLKNQFAEKYEEEIMKLKQEHNEKIIQLKEKHFKNLNGALERERRKSLIKDDEDNIDLMIKERDNLKKQTNSLRHLLGELFKYFTQCEDELNNTLIDELIKNGFVDDKSLTQIENELKQSSLSTISTTTTTTKRVHLTPNFNDIMNLIDNENSFESIDLKNELGACLEKLKSDANEILILSTNYHQDNNIKRASLDSNDEQQEQQLISLKQRLINETQIKNDLVNELKETKNVLKTLENERLNLEKQLEEFIIKQKIIENDLEKAHEKISELIENGHKEIVSEGYGEDGQKEMQGMIDAKAILVELQDKARNIIANNSTTTTYDQNLLHLIEELSRVAEKILEEARKEREDLKQQVDAADKKYKITCQFLEDQAAEREQERDEAQKEIDRLKEFLKEREKDRASCERINSEVEQLEQQLRDTYNRLIENDKRYHELEIEKQEAIEKIHDLRDVIRDLEIQIEIKTTKEDEQKIIIIELENIIKQQNQLNNDLNQRLNSINNLKNLDELQQHINSLENELQRLRLNHELVGNEGEIKGLKKQLSEFEVSLDKKTKDLEGLHCTVIATNCSSPSEDMSIRDLVNSQEPNVVFDECEVPLQQLARLREKLMRHSRAEDAAIKRIRDLEMQVFGLKNDLVELQNERDLFKKQISDQLILISSLQIRLDNQRLRAENIEKETKTSLEVRIYDLQNNIIGLEETIHKRDKTINQLNNVIDEIKQRIKDQENEMIEMNKNDQVLINLQKNIDHLNLENNQLKLRINNESQLLPNLVNNIILDKNCDIELLREKLSETEKQLQMFLSLNISQNELEALNKLRASGGISFIDLIDDDDNNKPEQIRKIHDDNESLSTTIINRINKKNVAATATAGVGAANNNDTVFVDLSEIERVDGPLMVAGGGNKANSTAVAAAASGGGKRVHFEDTLVEQQHIKELEMKLEELQQKLDNTELELKAATEAFEKEHIEIKELEKTLRIELAEKKMQLNEIEKKLGILELDSLRKDQMYINLAKEKRDIEKELLILKNQNNDDNNKIHEVEEEKEKNLMRLEKQIEDGVLKINSLENQVVELKENCVSKTEELSKLQIVIEKKDKKLNEQKDLLFDRKCEIEILNEDTKKYQDDLLKFENEIDGLKKIINKFDKQTNLKDLEIVKLKKQIIELNKELIHLNDLINEKQKIINQINDDSKSLRINLETIQNKMQETGNIIDLSKRLRDEQKKNTNLLEQIHNLKIQLFKQNKISRNGGGTVTSIDEITGQLQKELNYSAQLDTNLMNAVSDQSLNSLTDDLDIIKNDLFKQKTINTELIKANNELKQQLDQEKINLNSVQLEASNLIEQLRLRLNTVLDNINEYEKLLENEKKQRFELEKELIVLKEQLANNCTVIEKAVPSAAELQLKKVNDCLVKKNNEMVDDVIKKKKEIRQLNEQIDCLNEAQLALTTDLNNNKKELDAKIKQLEYMRDLMDEVDQERVNLKKQIAELNKTLETVQNERNKEPKELYEKLLIKIRELSLDVQDNKQILDVMERLRNENKLLEKENMKLQNQNLIDIPPFDDPTSRANYLFAKYLRTESYRKALTFQKRYLISLLKTYQTSSSTTTTTQLLINNMNEKGNGKIKTVKGKNRFKSAVSAVIAISRMQYLVKRWHSGKRLSNEVNSRYNRPCTATTTTTTTTKTTAVSAVAQFHVGEPVSSQHLMPPPPIHPPTAAAVKASRIQQSFNVERTRNYFEQSRNSPTVIENKIQNALDNIKNSSWTGASPPSKEKKSPHKVTSLVGSSVEPLTAPNLLQKYMERFNQIQERLGLVLDSSPLS